jgi:hypothetical protein
VKQLCKFGDEAAIEKPRTDPSELLRRRTWRWQLLVSMLDEQKKDGPYSNVWHLTSGEE